MNYRLLKDLVELVEEFEHQSHGFTADINGFRSWIKRGDLEVDLNLDWEGRGNGRSAESVISTLFVHLNRYARNYSKSAMQQSPFSTQEEFIYLINLKAFGSMTKTDLIKKNIQDKPVGMQIVNRLLKQGWVEQVNSETDKRSKIIKLTDLGSQVLEQNMNSIRKATLMVSGNLSLKEKHTLIYLLQKLDLFHQNIYSKNLNPLELLDTKKWIDHS